MVSGRTFLTTRQKETDCLLWQSSLNNFTPGLPILPSQQQEDISLVTYIGIIWKINKEMEKYDYIFW